MKKLFTTLLFLMAGILFVGAQTGTKTLKIGDVSIDLTKDGTYTNVGLNKGTATYKVSEKRLYLKNIYLQEKENCRHASLGCYLLYPFGVRP